MDGTVEIVYGGKTHVVRASKGTPLPSVLRTVGIPLDLPCGGRGCCRRCGVSAVGALSPPTDAERAAFGEDELSSGMRLACAVHIEGDACVSIAQSAALEHILSADAVGEACAPLYTEWGLAVDIGTTTLCAQLFGRTGAAHATARKNPQTAYGADVIRRVELALAGQGTELADVVRGAVRDMANELTARENLCAEAIDTLVLTGNTAMLYLFMGRNPETLSRAPFQADCLFGEWFSADGLALGVAPSGRVYLPRCVSAFVGADVVTAVLASGMCESRKTALLVDVGTNGEMALWHDGRLICCSTAAGPAFEGAGLSSGVYGVRGAIDRVWIEQGETRCSTIGGADPVGVCGSGIVDAVAAMLASCIIDETGAFCDARHAFVLAGGVSVTQRDVRQIQLAKGAVRAGMETLLGAEELTKESVERVYIAGGFGSYLNLNSAAVIGLIPSEFISRTVVLGNAAHTGAAMLLQDKELASRARAVAENARTLALDANPDFTENYMRYMLFQ